MNATPGSLEDYIGAAPAPRAISISSWFGTFLFPSPESEHTSSHARTETVKILP
jgi:hypothetical protein